MIFIRYISSAGSGKTYALVKEYLKLVLSNRWKFSHVLAITFTNKAAAEMKERIIGALRDLSLHRNPKLENILKKETDILDISRRSAEVLTKILHNYSDFSVMTIDSFFYKLLRSFSYEEEIPAGFKVELNLKTINDEIIRKIYSGIGRDPELTEIVIEYLISKIYAEKSIDIEKDIRSFVKEITGDRREADIDNLKKIDFHSLISVISELKKIFLLFIREMNDLGKQAAEIIAGSGLTVEDFAYKKNGAASFLVKLSDLNTSKLKKFKLNSYFENGSWYSKGTSPDVKEKIELLLKDGLDVIRKKILSLYDKSYQKSITAYLIFENIYLLGLARSISGFIEVYKHNNNIIPINEFNRRIFSIVKEDDIPFIYSILGNRFSNILIDEFQDTSRMQWESIFPLIENSLSEGNMCLAVGDPKQSIYRWRGGELEIIEKDIPEKIDPEQLKTLSLKTNYRALKNIVAFNNGMFSNIPEISERNIYLGEIYGNPSQESEKGDGGFVSVDFIAGKNSLITDPIILLQVKKIIDKLERSGFEYSEIAILTRMNSEAEKVASYLLSEGFPVISPDSLKLAGAPVTRFMINLLRLLFNPEDRIIMAEILFFLKDQFKGFLTLADIESYLIEDTFDSLPPELKKFLERKDLFKRLPIYETVERMIRLFKLNKSPEFVPSGFITTFLDMILDYSGEEGADISNFFSWWKINEDEYLIPSSGNSDGINIMTIHKAKGLEFNSVIIPFANWKYRSDGNIWAYGDEEDFGELPVSSPCYIKATGAVGNSLFRKSYEDEQKRVELDNVNLFYVACTRAVESLHIISREPGSGKHLNNAEILMDTTKRPGIMKEITPGLKYESGTLKKVIKRKEDEIPIREMKTLISGQWSDRITIRRRAKEFVNFISGERKNKIRFGNIVHKILSEISDKSDPEIIIEKMAVSGEISIDEAKSLKLTINSILSEEEVAGWFFGDGEILNETTLISKKSIVRPDKIIIKGDLVQVVDFKTGIMKESDIEQMKQYKMLLMGMGYSNVEGIIFYIKNREVVKV